MFRRSFYEVSLRPGQFQNYQRIFSVLIEVILAKEIEFLQSMNGLDEYQLIKNVFEMKTMSSRQRD